MLPICLNNYQEVTMWESPIYKFKTKVANKQQEIFIDVTGSAPNFSVPGKQLESTFANLLTDLKPKETKILDFGAAKLRNTIHLLKKGYTVYACEFEDLFKRSQQANEYLEEAKTYKNFKQLVFPHDFVNISIKFDVVLLINVLNVMPVPIERLLVLTLCKERIKNDGRLLWYTQHGSYSEKDAFATLNDGLVTGKGRTYHMFYRDFSRNEIHDMLKSTGFSHNNKFTFPKSGSSNQAYVFNSDGSILIDETLGLTKLLKRNSKRNLKSVERSVRWETDDEESEMIKYNSKQPTKITPLKNISILNTYLTELEKLKPGKNTAHKYHELIFNILKSVFDYCLKKPEMEETIANGIKRVDITFANHREQGFFAQLDQGYHIQCPNIFIECKNYNRELKNPEFDQMHGRLNNVRGAFGIIICRTIKKHDDGKKRQIDLARDGKYVILLEDSDIKKMVDYKLKNQESEIDNLLEIKLKQIV